MAKLPRQLSGKALLKVFHKLGFEVVRQRGSHVSLRHVDGRRLTIPACTSWTENEVAKQLIKLDMALARKSMERAVEEYQRPITAKSRR